MPFEGLGRLCFAEPNPFSLEETPEIEETLPIRRQLSSDEEQVLIPILFRGENGTTDVKSKCAFDVVFAGVPMTSALLLTLFDALNQ